MKRKRAIMSWLVFSTISLSSILADTNESQADPNQNKPQKHRLVTFEDNDKFKTVGSPHVSIDGKWIAYTLSKQIWIIPIEGGEPRGSSAWNPVWTTDGKALSFLSDRGADHTQVWTLKLDQFGEAEQVTKLKRSADSIKWSPQGDKFLFVFEDEAKKTDPNTPQDPADDAKKTYSLGKNGIAVANITPANGTGERRF